MAAPWRKRHTASCPPADSRWPSGSVHAIPDAPRMASDGMLQGRPETGGHYGPQQLEHRSVQTSLSLPKFERSVAVLVNDRAVRARLHKRLNDRSEPFVSRVMKGGVTAAVRAV